MTGKQLLAALKALDDNELNYTILIGVDDRWVKLSTIKKDFELKTMDLEGEKS